MAKLTDVAKLAGVSPTTVSRVINNYGYLSEKTKQKVFAAMKELHYQPNTLARSLQGKSLKLIGIIFPNISHPFFGELVNELENQLFEQGYKTIICNAVQDKDKEQNYLTMLKANQVDGIIAGAHNLGIKEYEETGLPIVSFDRYYSKEVPIVSADNYQGGQLAVTYLKNQGAKKIAFLGSSEPNNQRLKAYVDAVTDPLIFELSYHDSIETKKKQIAKLLAAKPDGVFVTDDLTAILLREAKPDLLVVGFDGTKIVQEYCPKLVTVVQPIHELAKKLIEVLLMRINHESTQLHYTLPVKLKTK